MYDANKTEAEVLKFWKNGDIFRKSLDLRRGSKPFVFFEGPPTANGHPGLHHILTRVFKDAVCRYKSMRGFFVLRRAGWDTHGLPVELEVEKELGFKNKKDIENYGIGKFNKMARQNVWKYKTEWEEMTRRTGFWLDTDHPYITYENDYIESVWNIIRHIWKKKLLYQAHRVVPFCTRCGTALSSHEVAQGYKTVIDRAVTVKFQISDSEFLNKLKASSSNSKTYILAWTTTPWTLPGNAALAVGGDITYYVLRIKDGDDNYILAKDLAEKTFNANYEILAEITGKDLVGLKYEPLFDIPRLKSENSYKIYAADFVSIEEGTGVVHTAAMYGEDDYRLGTEAGLPKFHTVDEQGKFINVSQGLDGKYVKDPATEDLVIRELEIRNLVFKIEDFEHDYPFCWRCDSPLLYYARSSWFIKMSAVREKLLKNNAKINWIPEHIKDGRFGQWLRDVKDWAFSRERYWGTPLPVWSCGQNQTGIPESELIISKQKGCGNIRVIGSVAEMAELASAASAKRNNYYTLRHSYTTRDEDGEMIISSDVKADKYHLTDKGRRQIGKIAEFIKARHNVDAIYSSPFIRTVETAEIVAKVLHLRAHKDERLREIEHGGCEGKSYKICPAKDKRKGMDDRPHDLSESWNDVRKRTAEFFDEMEEKHSNKNILIVGHGDPLWLLGSIAEAKTAEEIIADGRRYPGLGELSEIKFQVLPRNEYGELDLHRPFIDSITFKCDKCGASMKKVPDLIDVWFDSGAMPFAQWHWPFDKRQGFKEQFPADFIVEAIDQTRGWFYTLLAISTLLGKSSPYKNVISLAHILDEKGKKMSKSKGNVVSPFEVMEQFGADATRWYMYTVNQPGEYKLFSTREVEQRLKGFITTLDNCVRFWELYGNAKFKPETSDPGQVSNPNLLDKWILSRLNGLISGATASLDNYDLTSATRAIERFVVDDLSNWWLRRSRKRKEALGLLRFALLELAKIVAPFTPFMAEDFHARLHRGSKAVTESVHLHDWPKADKKLIDKKIEEKMNEARNIVAAGLALRKAQQIKVRQPLAKLMLRKRQAELENLIKEELNVKEIVYDESQKEDVLLDMRLTPVLVYEGYARELIRQTQDMRKEAKYKLDQKISGRWHSSDKEVSGAIHRWSDEVKKEVLLSKFMNGQHDDKAYDIEKEFELAPQRKIWIGLRK